MGCGLLAGGAFVAFPTCPIPEGDRPVKLTDMSTAKIGLDRHAKTRALARLEKMRLVSIDRQGNEAKKGLS